MKIKRRQLSELILRSLLLENTQLLQTDLIRFIKKHEKVLTKELKVSKKMLIVFVHVAIAISGRESTFGKGIRYNYTDWAESMLSTISHSTGIEGGGVRQYSIGPTQIKFSTVEADVPKKVRDTIKISGPGDLKNELKALLATISIIASNYNKAKSIGYKSSDPGEISGSKSTEKANKLFKSTGNAALDMAITAYNAGSDKIKHYEKGVNYIPCYGDYCVGESGTASYGYVKAISDYLTKNSIDTKE